MNGGGPLLTGFDQADEALRAGCTQYRKNEILLHDIESMKFPGNPEPSTLISHCLALILTAAEVTEPMLEKLRQVMPLLRRVTNDGLSMIPRALEDTRRFGKRRRVARARHKAVGEKS